MNKRMLYLAAEIVTPLAVVALLWVYTNDSGTFYYPPLGEVLTAFKDNWLFDRISSDFVPSLTRLLLGYSIAVAIGVSVGVMLGQRAWLRRQAHPVIEFLRAIPPPALIPFTILVFGVGSSAKVLLIAFVCVWPILLNTLDGIAAIEPTIRDTGQVYRIGWWDSITRVELPAAAPQIFAGMRTSLPLALILMVISEMLASTNGIGYFVLQSQRTYSITDMWSGILMLGIIGYILNALFTLIENRVLAWHRGPRAAAE